MKTALTLLFTFLLVSKTFASDLSIQSPILYQEGDEFYTIFTLTWNNAWRNARNHDAAWVFSKFNRGLNGYVHGYLHTNGHQIIETSKGAALEIEVPEDGVGAFIRLKNNYIGNIKTIIRLRIDASKFGNFNPRSAAFHVFGIEMVYIPAGGFTLGDPDARAQAYGAMYLSDNEGNAVGLFEINSEKQVIEVGPTTGNLYYKAPEGYEGDQTGTIPADFPKGVMPFYIMKYEPTQVQYADFLNSLSSDQSQHRANFGGKDYYQKRGTIKVENGKYIAGAPGRPCNFMSWDDGMAYADWAGLRPMTEFEFTKAARGPGKPIAGEYPWNTDSKLKVQRTYDQEGNFIMLNGWTEDQLSDETKAYFGASYYWVMDLAGSTWERVISIGHPKGRAFIGSHGDGRLSYYGFATNEDWPAGLTETGGFGFRGGGYYEFGRPYSEFLPYSPIAYRRFGGWSGGNRYEAYGQRFVRSVK